MLHACYRTEKLTHNFYVLPHLISKHEVRAMLAGNLKTHGIQLWDIFSNFINEYRFKAIIVN